MGVSQAGAAGPSEGSQVPGAAATFGSFTAGIPFASGQPINIVVPANSLFTSSENVKVVECEAPGGLPPTDPSLCDGNTINGSQIQPNANGSIDYHALTGSLFNLYALPDSQNLGESGSGPPTCNLTQACVLYIGLDQTDFTVNHVFSQTFFVAPVTGDTGQPAGDGSPPPPLTNTTLQVAPPSSAADGQQVTLTANVAPQVLPSTCTPSGQVNFFNGVTSIGSATIASGSAILQTTTLPVGGLSLSANYPGTSSCSGSTSSVVPYSIVSPQSGDQIPSSAVPSGVVTSGTPFSSGQAINVVIPANNQLPPNTNLNIVECAAPKLVLPTDPSACDGNTIQGETITANANGSVNYQGETGSLYTVYALPDQKSLGETQSSGTVCNAFTSCVLYIGTNQNDFTQPHFFTNFFYVQPNADDLGENPGDGTPLPDATTLSSQPAEESVFGQNVTLTATVVVNLPTCTPTGLVTFKNGSNVLGTGSLNGSDQATFSTTSLPLGPASFTASFAGSSGCPASVSFPAETFQVNKSGTTTTVSGLPTSPSNLQQSVTFTATVAAASPGAGTPTGMVTFKDGATTLGSGTLNGSAQATFTTTALSGGSHTITAVYGGDTDFTGSNGNTSYNVNLGGTTTSVGALPTSSVFGQSVTFTATVAPATNTDPVTGTVMFMDGATQIGTTQTLSGGMASVSTSSLSTASHNITAVYSGDTNYNGSTSTALPFVVSQAATTTALSAGAPASPSVFGQSVSFNATVTANTPGAGTPTGSVTLMDNGTAIAPSVNLTAGSATITTSALAVGSHSNITAVYSGDTNFATSTSTAQAYTVTKAGSTTILTPNPVSTSVFGQSVLLTAQVSPTAPGAGAPSGNVTFMDGAATLGTSSVGLGGLATFTTSTLSVGSHSLAAVYSGDGSFTTSTSSPAQTFVVSQASTTTALLSSANPSAPGASVTFTASVSAVAPGTGTPTGTVTFMDGSTQIGTPQTLSAGSASISSSSLSIGAHTVTAVYSGDADFTTSTSAALTQTVAHYGSTTSLTSSLNPSKANTAVTFTATAAGVGTSTTPTGSVAFRDGATLLGSGTLNSAGVATLTTSTLGAGTHSITAVYGGDGTFATSTSSALSQVVQPSGGYWLVARDGGIFTFGSSAQFFGSTGAIHLNQPIVGMAATPDNRGYWLVARDGGIFTFGDAQYHGSVPQIAKGLTGIVGMVVDRATGGYWIINSDGTVFNFDAPNDGTLPFFGVHVQNIVGGAATPDGTGLYLVGSGGQVYTMLGTATHQGSLAGKHLNAPIISMTIDPATGGYWLLGADGGVFSFNAPFFGSTGALRLNQPVVGMAPTSDGGGYWFVAADGGVFTFGDAVYAGSMGGIPLNQPVVGMAAAG